MHIHFIDQLINSRIHITRDSRADDQYRMNFVLRFLTTIHSLNRFINFFFNNELEQCVHLRSINRRFKYIDTRRRHFTCFIFFIIDKARIDKAFIISHTFIDFNFRIFSIGSRYIDEYIHTTFFVDIFNHLSNFFITIQRCLCNIEDIFKSTIFLRF